MSTHQMLPVDSVKITPVPLEFWGVPGRELHLLREDLTHPAYGGNKWRKLVYNLEKARQRGDRAVLTFGGPWSNHLLATAAACKEAGIGAIGMVRGTAPAPLTATLQDCTDLGMELHYLSRAEYAEKNTDYFKAHLRDVHGRVHIVPEGGSNFLGIQGCMEILSEAHDSYTDVCVAMGTGATAAGLLLGRRPGQTVWGFPVVKGGDGLRGAVHAQLYWSLLDQELVDDVMAHLTLRPAHGDGFAKTDGQLLGFMRDFYTQTGVKLDHVYTAKLVWTVVEAVREGCLTGTPLVVHTGGLQGLRGLEHALGEAVYPRGVND